MDADGIPPRSPVRRHQRPVLQRHLVRIELHEVMLRRKEFVLTGRGRIGPGRRVADSGGETIAHEIG